MGKLNSRQLERWISFLIARDGAKCYACNKTLGELDRKVTVDHKDGNPENNPKDGKNYGLLCFDCNRKKYKTPLSNLVTDRPMTPEMMRREIANPLFFNMLMHEINENHSCCFQEAKYDLSREAGISSDTAIKYIKQHLGRHGILAIAWGNCRSPLCDRVHIYLKTEAPILENATSLEE